MFTQVANAMLTETAAGGQMAQMILPLVILIAVFYFLLIRPENKRKKAADQMRSALKKGDKIVTIGGIMGTIVRVTEESIVIETSEDRVRMELAKWAVQTNTSAPQPEKGKKKEAIEEPKAEEAAPEAEESTEETKD